jgi:hypothetical protein
MMQGQRLAGRTLAKLIRLLSLFSPSMVSVPLLAVHHAYCLIKVRCTSTSTTYVSANRKPSYAETDYEQSISDAPIFELLQPILHLREGQHYTFPAFASSIRCHIFCIHASLPHELAITF